jgi:hypothetical protein
MPIEKYSEVQKQLECISKRHAVFSHEIFLNIIFPTSKVNVMELLSSIKPKSVNGLKEEKVTIRH